MKKYTNNSGLSIPLAVWSLMDNYNHDTRPNLISATSLLKPIRQIVLGRRYKDNIKEIDAENLIASSMGTALHDSVENAWKQKDKVIKILDSLGYINSEAIYDEVILECRSEKEIDGYIISGQFDIAFNGIVCDIKSTSVWSYIFGSKEEDYKLQMSIYRWLNQDIITNDTAFVEYIFTDWSGTKALQDKQYPQKRIITKEIKLLSLEDTEKYIKDKLALISKYEALEDKDLILCSDEELWREKDKWKYYKSGDTTKRATKVFATEEEAVNRMRVDGMTGKVVQYKGGVKRCNYCNYTNLCEQYMQLQIEGAIQ